MFNDDYYTTSKKPDLTNEVMSASDSDEDSYLKEIEAKTAKKETTTKRKANVKESKVEPKRPRKSK